MAITLPKVTGIITRTNGIKTRYKFNQATNSFHDTRNRSIAGKVVDGRFGIYSGGLPDLDGNAFNRAMSHLKNLHGSLLNDDARLYLIHTISVFILCDPELIEQQNMSNLDKLFGVIAQLKIAGFEINFRELLSKIQPPFIGRGCFPRLMALVERFSKLVEGIDPAALELINAHFIPYINNNELLKDGNATLLNAILAETRKCLLAGLDPDKVIMPALYQLDDLRQSHNDPEHLSSYLSLMIDTYVQLESAGIPINTDHFYDDYLIGDILMRYPYLLKPECFGELKSIMRVVIELWHVKTDLEFGLSSTFTDVIWAKLRYSIDTDNTLSILSAAKALLENNIYPTDDLMSVLARGDATVYELSDRLGQLMRGTTFDALNGSAIDTGLFYTVLATRMKGADSLPGVQQYGSFIQRLKEWKAKHPKFMKIEDLFPRFTVTGTGEVEVSDDVFDKELIDKHRDMLLDEYRLYKSCINPFIDLKVFSEEERDRFNRRVIAYIEINEQMRHGLMRPVRLVFKVSNNVLRQHERRIKLPLDKEALDKFGESFTTTPFVYLTALGGLMNSVQQGQHEKAAAYREMIMKYVIHYGIEQDHGIEMALEYPDTPLEKVLQALQQLYEDRIRHLPDVAHFPLPEDIRRMIADRFSELKGEYQKLGIAVKQPNIQEYSIAPAGMLALFRGYIGMDCSKDGNVPLWAFNPNNAYLIIKKGDKNKGYIGLTKCVTPEGKRVLLVDTMNPCPPGMVEPILRTLAKLAKEKGYDGVALPRVLSRSFNYPEVINAIRKAPFYKNGERIVLGPEDGTSWELYKTELGKDEYHSLSYLPDECVRDEDLEEFDNDRDNLDERGFVELRI